MTERESLRLMREAFEQASSSEVVRAVYAEYNSAHIALQVTANMLWKLGEARWAVSIESRVVDLEIQCRRHIDAIVERERAKATGGE